MTAFQRWGRIVAITAALSIWSTAAAAQSGVFSEQPSAEAFAHYYPPRAAAERLDGRVLVECATTADGRLSQCHVLEESPAGYGFGEAAIRLSVLYRLRTATSDGSALVSGASIRLPITFRAPAR